MPRHPKRGSKRPKQSGGNQRQVLDVSGFMNRMGLPVPRLPFLIGSATNLPDQLSVYPSNVKLDFPITPQFFNITSGALSTYLAISTNLCTLAADFIALFNEYSVVGAKFEMRINNAINQAGLILVYIDEKSLSAPVAAEAVARPHLELVVSNTESPSRHTIEWKARDYLDLQWTATNVATTPAYLKLFASTAATGTSGTTAAQVCVTGAISMCFRGYAQ
jgi:hypothetical protein